MSGFNCPQCGARLGPATGPLVSCASCGAETELAKLGQPAALVPSVGDLPEKPRRDHSRPRVDAPKELELIEEPGLLRFRWRLGSAVGALLPVAMALFGTTMMVRGHVISPLLIIPAFWLYIAAAFGLNRVEIEVRKASLRIKVGPVPWFGGGHYDASQLSQLYVEEHVYTNKGNTTVTYSLNARLKSGKHVKLVKALKSSEVALYLEQEIERKFEIEDRPVVNELPRDSS